MLAAYRLSFKETKTGRSYNEPINFMALILPRFASQSTLVNDKKKKTFLSSDCYFHFQN